MGKISAGILYTIIYYSPLFLRYMTHTHPNNFHFKHSESIYLVHFNISKQDSESDIESGCTNEIERSLDNL